MLSKKFDVIVIGAGSAGFAAAEAARAQGASVCLVEKERLGGECPNWACIPTKALLKSVRVLETIRDARRFGIMAGVARFDYNDIAEYRDQAVERTTGKQGSRYEELVKRLKISVIMGEAQLVDAQTIVVAGQEVQGKAFVIATGTQNTVPPIPGLAKAKFWTSREAVTARRQPKSVGIIGGGPVACELASFYQGIGTRVTLFQSQMFILGREDEEIAALAQQYLVEAGVEIVVNAQVKSILEGHGAFGISVVVDGREQRFAVERLLLAAGKRPYTEGLGLSAAGVIIEQTGAIRTDNRQRTSAKNIFAAGDVDGGMLFTHTAHAEGVIAGRNAALLALKKHLPPGRTSAPVVPRVTFLSPEVASVGMTSSQAKRKFKGALVGRWKIGALGRAVTEGQEKGIVKIVAHPKTGKVLGGHIIAERAGEMIHEIALAIHLRATVSQVGSLIHAFPTFSEGVAAAANSTKLEK